MNCYESVNLDAWAKPVIRLGNDMYPHASLGESGDDVTNIGPDPATEEWGVFPTDDRNTRKTGTHIAAPVSTGPECSES